MSGDRDPGLLAQRLRAAADELAIDGAPRELAPYGNGHINDTLLGVWDTPAGPRRYIHQRLNHAVFPDLAGLMGNVARVLDHLAASGVPADERLELVRARDGADHVEDAEGRWWRTYPFVEGTVTRERVTSPEEAGTACAAFGRFLGRLADLPPEALTVVIPGFHDTPQRIAQLDAAAADDPLGRRADCGAELAFVAERRAQAGTLVAGLADGSLPLRVTHNDTKLNNVLLDAATLTGRCVIDLDTLMPGSALFDIGDFLRFACSTAAEDEPEVDRIDCDLAVLRAAVTGFAGACPLNAAERALLPLAGPLLTFECGVRFLTDHLRGDRYFKIHHPGHNLQRARAQFALVAAFERRAEAIATICDEACREVAS